MSTSVTYLKKIFPYLKCLFLVALFVLLFQTQREQLYSRISAGNQLYQDLITSHVPETNNSLKELSVRVRNETCKSSNLQQLINEK